MVPPRQIRTAAPAPGGRKLGAVCTDNAPTPAYLLGFKVTTDELDGPVRASGVAILLPPGCRGSALRKAWTSDQ